jgi:autophagy-related protein 9
MSYPFATRYMEQFPKIKTEQVARTVAFIAGAIVTVLAIVTLIDPDMFLGFEITHDRTTLFYVGIFGSVWAAARGALSDDNLVFDPEYALRNVIEYTHYQPDHWQGRLHSFEVKKEFSELYKVKIVIFLEEILSILVTPLILFTSLPRSSDQIVDFFREFTVHIDGLGYVCSFAVFDFKKGVEQTKTGAGEDIRDDYYSTKHGKMAASYYGFLDNYVVNPKTGIPGHLPPGLRQQFQPPPAFPGLNSPTLAAEMQHSRLGRSERARSRAPVGGSHPARTPRSGPALPQPSPMASILLDPHHQPSAASFGVRSTHRHRATRGGYHGDNSVIEESMEDASDNGKLKPADEGEPFASEGPMDESTWQTSPTKMMSRENSGAAGEPQGGMLTMIHQLGQAGLNPRMGGVR